MRDENKLSQTNEPYPNQQQAIDTSDSNGQINLKQIFYKFFLKHWYLYVYTLTLALITAYFYNWYATPIYYTSCTVLIKDDKKKYNNDDLLSQLNSFNSIGGIENEIGIIRSRTLISKTIEELELTKSYFLKGDIKTTEVYKDIPIKLNEDTLSPSIYSTPLNISIINSKKFKLTYFSKGKEYIGYYLFDRKIKTTIGKFSIDKTESFDDKTFNNLSYDKRNYSIRLNSVELLANNYQSSLKADPISKQSSMLQISIQGPVTAKNEAFLDKICELYVKKGIDTKNEYAVNTLKFIDEQLELLTQDIDMNEANVEKFRVTRGITDLGVEATSFLESVKNFDIQISELQVQLSFLDYLEKYVSDGKVMAGSISPGSILVDDPLLKNLVLRLNELENKRKSALNLSKADNPLMVSMNIEIQNTRAALLENIKSLRSGLKVSLNEAMSQKGAVQGKLRLLPSAQRELQTMMRGSNIKETLYSYLLQKKAETAILLASTTADNRVIDTAKTFLKPLEPVKSLSYSIAVILGLIFPALIIYIKDLLNDKIIERFDVEKITNIPILGMIGLSASKNNLVVSEKPNSHISEAFRSIRTNLQYFNPNSTKNSIMLTSSISSEGKSFCSVNLAVMLAMSGRKTVLVSCDLRKPKFTIGFDFTSEVGLSNYLIGVATIDEIIQNTGSIPNLNVILSGPKPPNSSELIISPKMDELFAILRERYDNIILDTPPIGLITDAMVLSKYTDINIYVVRQGVTRKQHLNFINKLYTEGKIKNTCIILNAIKAANKSYGYGYEYSYGYGYGYGYGYYEDDATNSSFGSTLKSLFKSKKSKKKV